MVVVGTSEHWLLKYFLGFNCSGLFLHTAFCCSFLYPPGLKSSHPHFFGGGFGIGGLLTNLVIMLLCTLLCTV